MVSLSGRRRGIAVLVILVFPFGFSRELQSRKLHVGELVLERTWDPPAAAALRGSWNHGALGPQRLESGCFTWGRERLGPSSWPVGTEEGLRPVMDGRGDLGEDLHRFSSPTVLGCASFLVTIAALPSRFYSLLMYRRVASQQAEID